jgi:uncharacterized membrane protein
MSPLTVLLATVIILVVDIPWLLFNSDRSARMILDIQGSTLSIRWFPAFLVYPALAALILQANSVQQAAIIGLATYAVYDLTNYAILKNYPLDFAIMDIIWGSILFSISYLILSKLKYV